MSSLVLGESEGVPAIGQSDHLHQRRIGLICDGHPLTAVMSVPAPGKSKIVNHQENGGHGGDPCFSAGPKITSVPFLPRKKYRKFYRGASNMPYSLCCELTPPKCPWNRCYPGAALKQHFKGDAVVRVSRLRRKP